MFQQLESDGVPRAKGRSLALLKVGDAGRIVRLGTAGVQQQQALLVRLLELGFLPGEVVQVIARGAGGGDPLAVRIGDSTFALRSDEAALVLVAPLSETTHA